MAIAFDAQSTGVANPGTSVTVSQTCTGSNLLLLVHVGTNDTTDKVTGVTYNAVAMTRLDAKAAATTGFFGFVYYLVNPATGAHNIVASRSDSNLITVDAVSYTGVSQTGFPDSQANGTVALGNITATTTVVASNCWLFGATRGNNGVSGITAGAGTTLRTGNFSNALVSSDSNGTVATGSQTLNYNISAGGECYWMICSFAPVATSAIKTIDGLAKASVKTVKGLAIASVKTWDGLA